MGTGHIRWQIEVNMIGALDAARRGGEVLEVEDEDM